MNILFLSNRSKSPWAGPYYSIPAQVKAQSKIDNVLWLNENSKPCQEWQSSGVHFMNLKDTRANHLNTLPAPFNYPDIVIVEEIYAHRFSHIIAGVQKKGIPYVMVPRSQLTIQGQRRKPFKKWLGNLIYHKQLVRRAAAIQYLTKQEQADSGPKWNKNSFVLPNGINLPDLPSKIFSSDKIKAVYIGRLEKYQKGLDLLLQACNQLRDELLTSNFTLTLYGPDYDQTQMYLADLIKRYSLEQIIFLCPPVFKDDKTAALQKAEVFIMTSRFEGHPMGLIEALAYGLPCVVTTGTNMRSEIEKYNAGWTADNKVESIVCALKKMLQEREHFAQKSNHARKLAEQYNWDKIAQRSHKIYEEIIREK